MLISMLAGLHNLTSFEPVFNYLNPFLLHVHITPVLKRLFCGSDRCRINFFFDSVITIFHKKNPIRTPMQSLLVVCNNSIEIVISIDLKIIITNFYS
jgi:hypothetical protein